MNIMGFLLSALLAGQLTVVGSLAPRVTATDSLPNYPLEGWGTYRGYVAQMDGGWWRCTEDNDYWVSKPMPPFRGWQLLHTTQLQNYGNFLDKTETFRQDDTCDILPVPAPPTEQVPPPAPTNLSVSAATSVSVLLTWTDNATNETHQRLRRLQQVAQPDGSIVVESTIVANLEPNVTTFLWAGLEPGTTYEVRMGACNEVACVYTPSAFVSTLREPEEPDPGPEPPTDTIPPGGWSLADSIPQGRVLAPGNFYWHVLIDGEPFSQHTTQHVAFTVALGEWQKAVTTGHPTVDVRVCTDVEMDGYCYQIVKGETVVFP